MRAVEQLINHLQTVQTENGMGSSQLGQEYFIGNTDITLVPLADTFQLSQIDRVGLICRGELFQKFCNLCSDFITGHVFHGQKFL